LTKPITKVSIKNADVIIKTDLIILNFYMRQYFVICNLHTKFQSDSITGRAS